MPVSRTTPAAGEFVADDGDARAAAKAVADAVAKTLTPAPAPATQNGTKKRGKKNDDEESTEPTREDKFITKLQAALEGELGQLQVLGFKERNGLYVNCIKFLAVLTKYTDKGGEDGESFWGGKD